MKSKLSRTGQAFLDRSNQLLPPTWRLPCLGLVWLIPDDHGLVMQLAETDFVVRVGNCSLKAPPFSAPGFVAFHLPTVSGSLAAIPACLIHHYHRTFHYKPRLLDYIGDLPNVLTPHEWISSPPHVPGRNYHPFQTFNKETKIQ